MMSINLNEKFHIVYLIILLFALKKVQFGNHEYRKVCSSCITNASECLRMPMEISRREVVEKCNGELVISKVHEPWWCSGFIMGS